jgi:hypothetical protein
MDEKLLPCPFCGSEKHSVLPPTCDKNTPYNPNDRAFPIVRCGGCFTEVPGKDWDASCKTAGQRWNDRVDNTEVEKLREIVERAQAIVSTSTYPNWHESASAALSRPAGKEYA